MLRAWQDKPEAARYALMLRAEDLPLGKPTELPLSVSKTTDRVESSRGGLASERTNERRQPAARLDYLQQYFFSFFGPCWSRGLACLPAPVVFSVVRQKGVGECILKRNGGGKKEGVCTSPPPARAPSRHAPALPLTPPPSTLLDFLVAHPLPDPCT